jgi:type III secretion protein D
MKQLRILTGQHAGAHVDLMSRRNEISAEETADIQLLDWTSEPMVIEVDEDDMLRFAMVASGSGETPADAFTPLEDFAPRRFGDVVLCAGPADDVWPATVDLIASLTALVAPQAPATPAVAAATPTRWRFSPFMLSAFVGTALMTAGLGAAVARLGHGTEQQADGKPIVEPLKTRIERALAGSAIGGLEVIQQGDGVIVRGLLREPSDADSLRMRLSAFRGERVVHAYAAATEVAQSIAEALGQPGLRVSHLGEGRFSVIGETDDLARLRESAAGVATDLAPLVRRIEVAATQAPPSGHAPLSAALSAEGLQYVQTRDGVKHLSVSSAGLDSLADTTSR